jgi:hypothetical protein
VSPVIGVGEQKTVFKDTNVNDLINIRSDLLSFSRDAAARGEAANANFYGRLAESTLQDLNTLQSPAYDAARQFSRSLNDTFTRTYAGDVATGVTKTGAEKIPAEILVLIRSKKPCSSFEAFDKAKYRSTKTKMA